jgi:YD repeat-containing protein
VNATVSGAVITMTAAGAGPYSISFSVSFSDYTTLTFSATPTSGTLTGGTGGITSSPSVTTYTYDALGNLTGVTQGSQNRSYQSDGLSRLTREITPEAGKVTLSYGAPGSLCHGNPSNPCSRTAPAPNQTGSATVATSYTSPLDESANVRKGKFTQVEVTRLLITLPKYLVDMAEFAYETGARAGEILKLRWTYVRGDAIEVPATDTKNRKPRSIVIN